jgi:hypothetical protein
MDGLKDIGHTILSVPFLTKLESYVRVRISTQARPTT